jgi:signal transduction histidine kinase
MERVSKLKAAIIILTFIMFFGIIIPIKTNFIARMSHDMRTPMSAILGLYDFGIDEVTEEPGHRYFEQIKESFDKDTPIIALSANASAEDVEKSVAV